MGISSRGEQSVQAKYVVLGRRDQQGVSESPQERWESSGAPDAPGLAGRPIGLCPLERTL